MLKRTSKITALLVAATSMISIVPAMAASNQGLSTQEGTIETAVAFKDGKYIYEGYKDSDNTGIYYNGGDKDKLVDGIQSANLKSSYDGSYAFAEDGSKQYLVDLSSGSVNDSTPEDKQDTDQVKLKSKLKNADRYGQISDVTLEQIKKGANFGDVWYEYSATPASGADGSSSTVGGSLYGFVNQDAKYIDASYVANIYAYSSKSAKTVEITNFSNKLSDVDSSTKLLATLAGKPEVLAQDKDYLYVKVSVQIYDENAAAGDITGTKASSSLAGADASKVVTRTYIQKISKAQGDTKDGAYLPKSVESYEVTKGELDSDKANDAYDAISGATDYSVVDGNLLAINKTSNNVKVTSINLKKDKVKFKVTKPTSLGSTDKIDAYLVEKDGSDDVDVSSNENSYSIDVDGNVWVVADGKIEEFKNNTMTKVYTCDTALDSINVYDENSLISWKKDGNIYATVKEGKSDTGSTDTGNAANGGTTGAGQNTSTTQSGWQQLANGTWNYYESGNKAANKWLQVGGVWYYFKADGTMATGWQQVGGVWYYMASSGAMKTGWVSDGGAWYYMNSSGAMATGWVNDGGTWYYMNSSGAMAYNTTIDGYRLSSSGAMV